MTTVKKLLAQTANELVEGQALIKDIKKKIKAAKGNKLASKNAKVSLKLIEQAVESIADHRQLLKEQITAPSTLADTASS